MRKWRGFSDWVFELLLRAGRNFREDLQFNRCRFVDGGGLTVGPRES